MELAAENKIRQRVLSIFNKGEDEFGSAREYDDYLEQVEDIVFNLCQRIDVPATEARIAAYQAANADSITANRVKRAEEERAALAAEEASAAAGAAPPLDATPGRDGAAAASSDVAPMSVTPAGPPSQGLTFALQPPLLAGAPAVQPLPLPPAALHVSHVSAEPESAEQLRERERVAALASGFTPALVRQRALHDAFDSLVF